MEFLDDGAEAGVVAWLLLIQYSLFNIHHSLARVDGFFIQNFRIFQD